MLLGEITFAITTEMIYWIVGGIATTASGFIVAFFRWLKPYVENILSSIYLLIDDLRGQHTVLENHSQTSLIMAATNSRLEAKCHHRRNSFLVVDDDVVSLRVVEHAIAIAKGKSESYKFCNTLHVGSMHGIYDHIYDAIVIVLDVMMPGNTEKDIKIFVRNYIGCPVVLFTSVDDMKLEDFPGAFEMVHKSKGTQALADAIHRALEQASQVRAS